MLGYRILATLIIFVGSIQKQALAWDIADLLMGIMALINLPAILILGNVAIKALHDYEKQKADGKNPVFKAKDIGLDSTSLDYWK